MFVGVGLSEAVELTQQLHTQRLARFLPSPLVCSVSLPTPYHSHPGASNLYWEIRKTYPRRWHDTDSGGTTAEVLCPENTSYLWKTRLSLKLCVLELGSRGNGGRDFPKAPSRFQHRPLKGGVCGSKGDLPPHRACADLFTAAISDGLPWASGVAWACNASRNWNSWGFCAWPEVCLDLWKQEGWIYVSSSLCS